MKLLSVIILLLLFLVCSCSNEPLEIELGLENNENEEVEEGPNEPTVDTIYATAKLDGQTFTANQFEINTLSNDKMRLSFLTELEQELYFILPITPSIGTFTITTATDSNILYSGTYINSVGNVSESIFYSIAETGTLKIQSYNQETGLLKGEFSFEVATFNNNVIVITEGEFEVNLD